MSTEVAMEGITKIDRAAFELWHYLNHTAVFPFDAMMQRTGNALFFQLLPGVNTGEHERRIHELLEKRAITLSTDKEWWQRKCMPLRMMQGWNWAHIYSYPLRACTDMLSAVDKHGLASTLSLWRNLFLSDEWHFRAESFAEETGVRLEYWGNSDSARIIYSRVESLLASPCPFVENTVLAESHFCASFPDRMTVGTEVHDGLGIVALVKMFNYTGGSSMPGFSVEALPTTLNQKFAQADLAYGGFHFFFKELISAAELDSTLKTVPDYRVANAAEACLYWLFRFIKSTEMPMHHCGGPKDGCVDQDPNSFFELSNRKPDCPHAPMITTSSVADDGSPVVLICDGLEGGLRLESVKSLEAKLGQPPHLGNLLVRSVL